MLLELNTYTMVFNGFKGQFNLTLSTRTELLSRISSA
jgi:hypothetical protein